MASKTKQPLKVTFPQDRLAEIQYLFGQTETTETSVLGAAAVYAQLRPRTIPYDVPFVTEDEHNGTFGVYGPSLDDPSKMVYVKFPMHPEKGVCIPVAWDDVDHLKLQKRFTYWNQLMTAFHTACLDAMTLADFQSS